MGPMRRFASVAMGDGLLLFALSGVARGQSLAWRDVGEYRSDGFGISVATFDDIDGDGTADLLVGTNGYGRVLIVSGATAAVLRELASVEPGESLGGPATLLDDLDADGRREFAVTRPYRPNADGTFGAIDVYSSAGTRLRIVPPTPPANVLGASVASIDDLDLDGVDEMLFVEREDNGYTGTGFATIVSGATGAVLRQHSGPNWSDGISGATYATRAGAVGDVDGDGRRDYVVYSAEWSGFGYSSSSAVSGTIYSGATGGFLGGYGGSWCDLRDAGDTDQDGRDEVAFATGGAGYYGAWSKTTVESVADGVTLYELGIGESVLPVLSSDRDGDGVRDLVAATINWNDPESPPPTLCRWFSGRDGGLLAEWTVFREAISNSILPTCADADLDGDGNVDVVIGAYTAEQEGGAAGGAVAFSNGIDGTMMRELRGAGRQSKHGAAVAILSDQDGDGAREVLIAVPGTLGGDRAFLQVVSGSDGSELVRWHPTGGVSDYAKLAAIDDLDGDDALDFAVRREDGAFEVRDGIAGQLLRTIAPVSGDLVASARDVDGTIWLATGIRSGSRIELHDLTRGTAPRVVTSYGSDGVSSIGDADGDGSIDWVTCAPPSGKKNGTVTAFAGGTTNRTIWSLTGTKTDQLLFATAVGDLSGDDLPDVIVYTNGSSKGRISARSGRDGAFLFQLDGTTAGEGFGLDVLGIGDVNLDGCADVAVSAPRWSRPSSSPLGAANWVGRLDLVSGRTGRVLGSIEGTEANEYMPQELPTARLGEECRIDRDAIPDLLVGAPTVTKDGVYGAGEVRHYRLQDLFLQLSPTVADPGATVTADTRGGPNGSSCGLYLVAIDGIPLDQFCAFGALDAFGEWQVADDVPAGLSGTTFSLQSYAIGFDGKLARSVVQDLVFR